MGLHIQRKQQQLLHRCGKLFDVAWQGIAWGHGLLGSFKDRAGGPLLCW